MQIVSWICVEIFVKYANANISSLRNSSLRYVARATHDHIFDKLQDSRGYQES